MDGSKERFYLFLWSPVSKRKTSGVVGGFFSPGDIHMLDTREQGFLGGSACRTHFFSKVGK
jgi:hypothetical protein